MSAGLAVIAAVPAATPVWVLAALMVPVGLTIPPMTAVLLNAVPGHRAGTASQHPRASRSTPPVHWKGATR